MKKKKFSTILTLILGSFFFTFPVFAVDLDSSIIISDNRANSYSYGVNYYQDSQVLTGYDTSGCGTDCVLLISSSTPYTVLKVDFQGSYQGGASPSIWCGSTPVITYWIQEIGSVSSDQQSFSLQSPLHCSENFYLDNADNMSWFVQFVSYDTRIVATSSVSTSTQVEIPTYRDWLIVVQWIIFILGFILWGYIFSPLRKL